MSTHDNDPVEEFFDRERGQVEPLPSSGEHWDSIVAEHRRRRRGRSLGLVAASAAAALVIGGTVFALNRPATDEDALPATSTTTSQTSSTSGTTTTATATATATGRQTGTGTPTTGPAGPGRIAGFTSIRSITTAADGVLFALGGTPCAAGTCPTVATSSDNGATWAAVKTFTDHTLAPRADGSATGLGAKGMLRDIRFANRTTGWVFGTDVLRTTDGGRTWQPYGSTGHPVLARETDGTHVDTLVSPSCDATGCAGPLTVLSTTIDATIPPNGGTPIAGTDGQTITEATLSELRFPSAQGGRTSFPSLHWTAASAQSGSVRFVEGDRPQPVALPGCASAGTEFQAADGKTLFGWCLGGIATGNRAVSVFAEDGSGRWTSTATPGSAPLLLAGIPTALTASDAKHLVAASRAAGPGLGGSIRYSTDGGATWREPQGLPPGPDAGWAWVGAAGGDRVLAVPAGDSSSYWLSTDRGASWARIAIGS